MTTEAALSRLSLNQRTTASWSLPEAIKGCVDAGLGAIGIWREQLAEVGVDEAGRLVAESGLRVSSLCRGGFFTTADPAEAEAAEAREPGGDRGGCGAQRGHVSAGTRRVAAW